METMLKLKKMPNIAGWLHYKSQSRNDHLYIREDSVKKEKEVKMNKSKHNKDFFYSTTSFNI